MNIIKLETLSSNKVLLNLDNVSCLKERTSHFGDKYTEIVLSCGKSLDVKEQVEHIELRLGN
tara:strand:+ start:226 stop:411 length:186 start_codon:yes stop_codon:yes gene_type:complete